MYNADREKQLFYCVFYSTRTRKAGIQLGYATAQV